MLKTSFAAFIVSTFVTGVLVMPDGADAKWARHSASECMLDGAIRSLPAVRNSGPNWGFATCPISDDDGFPKGEIQRLNIHVYDGHASVSVVARVCMSNPWVLGAECGPYASSGNQYVGHATLSPSTDIWRKRDAEGNFGYMVVDLPPAENGVNIPIFGYYGGPTAGWSAVTGFSTADF